MDGKEFRVLSGVSTALRHRPSWEGCGEGSDVKRRPSDEFGSVRERFAVLH
jgi:hypothetical protein